MTAFCHISNCYSVYCSFKWSKHRIHQKDWISGMWVINPSNDFWQISSTSSSFGNNWYTEWMIPLRQGSHLRIPMAKYLISPPPTLPTHTSLETPCWVWLIFILFPVSPEHLNVFTFHVWIQHLLVFPCSIPGGNTSGAGSGPHAGRELPIEEERIASPSVSHFSSAYCRIKRNRGKGSWNIYELWRIWPRGKNTVPRFLQSPVRDRPR